MTTTNTEAVTNAVSSNLQDALAVIINKTVAGVDAASGFLQEQIPDVIHQLLVWKMASAILAIVVNVAIAVVAVVLLLKLYKKAKEELDKNRWNDGWMVATVISSCVYCVVGIPIHIITFYNASMMALQIWLAPKVWLIEYAAKLVKGN